MDRTKTYQSVLRSKRASTNPKLRTKMKTRMEERKKYGIGGFLASNAVPLAVKGIQKLMNKPEKEPMQPQTVSSGSYGVMAKGGYMPNSRGGYAHNLDQGKKAYGFKGNSHATGGIAMDNNTEIEGNETMDNVKGKQYVFSDRVKVPGSRKTFAQRHKELKEAGASKGAVEALTRMQERVTGRSYKNLSGNKKMFTGGFTTDDDEITVTGEAPDPITNDLPTLVLGSSDPGNNTKFEKQEFKKMSIPKYRKPLFSDKFKSMAIQLAPDAINAMTGIFGKDTTREATRVPRTEVNRSYKGYNINPGLRRNTSSYRSIVSDPSATVNQKLASQMMKGQADRQLFADKENRDSQAGMQYDLSQARMDSYRNTRQAGLNEQFRQDKMISESNLGVTGNFARNSYASIANKLLMSKREKNLTARDKELLAMYRKIYGGI